MFNLFAIDAGTTVLLNIVAKQGYARTIAGSVGLIGLPTAHEAPYRVTSGRKTDVSAVTISTSWSVTASGTSWPWSLPSEALTRWSGVLLTSTSAATCSVMVATTPLSSKGKG